MPTDDHALVNRATWDQDAPNWVERGREAWARKEPVWGRGNLESELQLLPDVVGLDAIELGCGTAYVSAWLMRPGARVVGLDNSSSQLTTAWMLQEEFGLRFPLVHADAERPPFADASFDFAISQYGASIWCGPVPVDPGGLTDSAGWRPPRVRDGFPFRDVLLSDRRRRCACGLAAPSRLLRHAPVRVARTERSRRRHRVSARAR
jgi:SAM-dependent methyltransferase